jgi:hypothetical protein
MLVRPRWKGETDQLALHSSRKLGTVRQKSELVPLRPSKPAHSHTSAGLLAGSFQYIEGSSNLHRVEI